jgi:Lar family restriction alleviation protein
MGCDQMLYPPGSQTLKTPERQFIAGLDLKSCPFCGAPGRIAVVDLTCHSTLVECSDEDGCGAEGPAEWTVEEAVSRWNTRAVRPTRTMGEGHCRLSKCECLKVMSNSLRPTGCKNWVYPPRSEAQSTQTTEAK